MDKTLRTNPNAPKDFLGWLELPSNYDKEEFDRIKKAAEKIKNDSEVFVSIGIGGSYLGARAVIDALTSSFYNYKKQKTPQMLYAGNSISPVYLNELIEVIGDRDFSINVISKSGT
ncbi:MAG: glucose-6-phosphate isomerase, partial [Clostridia bacterium]|nr:glucose-6-phosphate isomerase [Clostridia bacterium]